MEIYVYEDLDGGVGVSEKEPTFKVKFKTTAKLTIDQVDEIIRYGDMSLPLEIVRDFKKSKLVVNNK